METRDLAAKSTPDLAPCSYCQRHAANVVMCHLMGTPGPGQPTIYRQYFTVICEVCGCRGRPNPDRAAAVDEWGRGPSDGDDWFTHLGYETWH